jgi:2-polyprenyl-3-methyl-5-hydroxy-6-metoxy-1,4-benzoquinol methylase
MNCQGGNLSDYAGEKHIFNRFRYIVGELRDKRGTVLVIGSGDGSFERILKEVNPNLSVTSIDINETFREKVARVSDTVIIDDFLTHEFDRTFDFLVSVDVIEHIIPSDMFLLKARDLLNPEGIFYLQTPNLASWHGRLSLLFGYQPEALEVSAVKSFFGKFRIFRHDAAIHHVHVFTYRALREMCAFYGFEIITAAGVDHRIPRLMKPFPGIAGAVCLQLRRREPFTPPA